MKVSAQSLVLSSSLLASGALASTSESLLRKRQLQFDGLDELMPPPPEGENNDNPLADLLDGLAQGFEDMINMTAINAMDPLVLGDNSTTMTVFGEVGNFIHTITNCTGNIIVTLDPAILTGLSLLRMDRFELVENTQSMEQSNTTNWWNPILMWSGTFDMLATLAGDLVLQTGITIAPQEDTTCVPADLAEADGSFTTGINVTLSNPVLEMFLEIGGSTPDGFFNTFFGGDQQSVADQISTDHVSFTYDSWTVTFDNPNFDQTINMTQVIDMVDAFLQDSFNITDFDFDFSDFNNMIPGLEGFNQDDGAAGLEGVNGITTFIQDQTNAVAKRSGSFSF